MGRIDSLKDLEKIFTSPLGGGFPFGSYYRPISELSYGIDYLLWGKNPMGYHITDLLLHLANSTLVFLISGVLFKDYKRGLLAAWISSILFLLSPINLSIIPTMERRQDMLMALLFCLSLVTFSKVEQTEKNKTGWYLLSLVMGFLSIFSKESAFVLPVLIWLLSFIFNEKNDYRERAIRATKYSIPFLGLTLLNTFLHLYFFGHWNVHISSGVLQRVEAAIKSFFTFAGPLGLLGFGLILKATVLFIVLLTFFLILLRVIARHGIQGFLALILNKNTRIYTYLIAFILTFMALFTIRGTSHDFYHYLPNMALTTLIALLLIDAFSNKVISIVMKSIGAVFVIYTVMCSPIFTDYSAWKNSSDITRQIIQDTEQVLASDKDASRIYLINWPGFIGSESDIPGTNSTILVSYSMNAWAEWSGLRASRDVQFIHISYASFPAGDLKANFNYTFFGKKINMVVKGCQISPSKIPYKGEVPFKFSVNEDKTGGEIVFTRKLQDNERLFLYHTGGLKIIGRNFKS
jgi:MFS family permease